MRQAAADQTVFKTQTRSEGQGAGGAWPKTLKACLRGVADSFGTVESTSCSNITLPDDVREVAGCHFGLRPHTEGLCNEAAMLTPGFLTPDLKGPGSYYRWTGEHFEVIALLAPPPTSPPPHVYWPSGPSLAPFHFLVRHLAPSQPPP